MRRIALAGIGAAVLLASPAQAGCNTRACEKRVAKKKTNAKWRKAVNAYGPGLLAARRNCESGSSGGYDLSTTGNGYWFAYQFDAQAWAGAGGDVAGGRPVGARSLQPSPLEQDYRAVRWAYVHGGDPWPNCP